MPKPHPAAVVTRPTMSAFTSNGTVGGRPD
jgi:hypothetical protein